MINRPITLAILLFFPLAACADREFRWTGTISDSAGVTIVSNTEVGIWRPGEEWLLEEELRIGVAEGNPDYQFGVIMGVTVDSHGRIFVLDFQAQHIQVYSADGVYERTLGGPGEGPGELRAAVSILMGPGDTIVVPDPQNQRMNRFALDGSFIGSSRFGREDGISDFRTNNSGVIAQQIMPFVAALRWPENPEDVIVIWTSDGTPSDTLATFPSGQMVFMEGGTLHSNLYAPQPCWDLTDDMRLLFGMNDEYRFHIFSPGQRLDRVVTKAHEPQPVSDQDINRVRSYLENRWSRGGAPPAQASRLWSLWHINEFFPAFQALYEGPAGTTWVLKVRPPSEMTEDETVALNFPEEWAARGWDVFDSEGRFLGVVTMPPRFIPRVFWGNTIYGVGRDEFDVESVVRLRIVGDLGAGAE